MRKPEIIHGDCLVEMQRLIDDRRTFHACVCDPPYHLTSIVKRYSKATPEDIEKNAIQARGEGQSAAPYARAARGFMGKIWDGGEVAFQHKTWRLVYDLLPPGGHLLAFSGTRTYHRMACAIEDAGFEIRDQIGWLYGTGFPKSHDVSKTAGEEWRGWGTALKPAWEPIVVARKPTIGTVADSVLKYGTGALNIDASRIETGDNLNGGAYAINGTDRKGDWGKSNGFRRNQGLEFIQPTGRWPANIIHDGSKEVSDSFPDTGPGGDISGNEPAPLTKNSYGKYANRDSFSAFSDSGSASRFFYSAKASPADRMGSKHPTVKPIDLMAYLCRLVTPPGGKVLDCFAGSGSTGIGAMREGFHATLIEREAEYIEDIHARLDYICGLDTPLFKAAFDTGKPDA